MLLSKRLHLALIFFEFHLDKALYHEILLQLLILRD